MSKKAWIVMIIGILALSALGVMAQDQPGVINFQVPDGPLVPVFTDGRINAFDIGAPVVVYYRSQTGEVLNPNIAGPSFLGDLSLDPNAGIQAGSAIAAGAASVQPGPNTLLESVQVLAIDQATSNGNVVIEASVDDLRALVNGQQNSISSNGYSLNYDRSSNWFWVQSPPNFEGKVYTFAWENVLFPRPQIVASPQAQLQSQATAQPDTDADMDATAQPTAQATTQPTTQPTAQPTTSP